MKFRNTSAITILIIVISLTIYQVYLMNLMISLVDPNTSMATKISIYGYLQPLFNQLQYSQNFIYQCAVLMKYLVIAIIFGYITFFIFNFQSIKKTLFNDYSTSIKFYLKISGIYILLIILFFLIDYITNGIYKDEILKYNYKLISSLLLSPVMEELVFRGLLIGLSLFIVENLTSNRGYKYTFIVAVIIIVSSLLDTMLHGQYSKIGMVCTFLVFLYIGYVFYITRNVFFTILLHIFINSISIISICFWE